MVKQVKCDICGKVDSEFKNYKVVYFNLEWKDFCPICNEKWAKMEGQLIKESEERRMAAFERTVLLHKKEEQDGDTKQERVGSVNTAAD